MPKRAVLMTNGPLHSDAVPYVRSAVADADLLIGVDGGARHLLQLDLLPDLVTGDFDSLTEAERTDLESRGVRLIPTPDQEFTDLDKALTLAIDTFGATSLRVFAATSGRLDHLYSALSAVLKHSRRADVRLVDEVGETWTVTNDFVLRGAELPGRTLSLLAFGPVHGIVTTGLRWPLNDETLAPGVRDGTLNEIVAEEVTIKVGAGDLMVHLARNLSP